MTAPVEHELADLQWELDGVVLGLHTVYNVSTFEWGDAGTRTNDSDAPRSDGRVFGRDYRSGRTLTMDLNVLGGNAAEGLARLDVLESAWQADVVRTQPGALSVMRYRTGGRTRRVWGRPRRFQVDSSRDWTGNIPVTATFDTLDHLFYGDVLETEQVPFVPAAVGGLVGAQAEGWQASAAGDASGFIRSLGTKPSWLVWRINGPIVNPSIEVVGGWRATLQTTVNYDQTITVDPTPWNRSVRRNDGANMAGAFSANSPPLRGMQIRPGISQVILRGIDPTGNSSATVSVRDVFASY